MADDTEHEKPKTTPKPHPRRRKSTGTGAKAAPKRAPKSTIEAVEEKAGKAMRGAVKRAENTKTRTWAAAGIGVGIGSAALAAALLYADRLRRKQQPGPKSVIREPEDS